LKLLIAVLALVCLTLAAVPALAQGNVYDNGPVNGQVDAWTINFGFVVTDTFTVSNGNGRIGGMDFWTWLDPGDTLDSVEVQIGIEAFGNTLMDLTVGVTQSNCFVNQYRYDVCLETSTFNGPNLGNSGNYWVTLSNAVTAGGNPVYWDENSGAGCQSPGCPSLAENNSLGSLPSEAFTLTAQGTTTTTGSTPEPDSILLFGAGALAVVGRLRAKLF
jgi:hypothetical protein